MYRNNHSHAIYTSEQCDRRSTKATIGLEGGIDNFTDFVLCWFHPFSKGIWCDTEIQEWLVHWHDKALRYRSYCNKTKLVIRWKNTWNNDFKNMNKNNISICLSIQSFDITLNHLRMTQTICKCLREFLLYTQTITQQSSRPFVIKLDHFAHDYDLTNRFLFAGIALTSIPVDSFSSDQIVCSFGEPFHTKQPDYFILRMIISLLFSEPFPNSSLDHLHFVCAIWHDCIFGGNGSP